MSTVLDIVPAGVFSTAYNLVADGVPKGRIEHRILSARDEASIVTPAGIFTARRERVFRAGAVLTSADGSVRAAADRESSWRENYRVTFEGRLVYLRQQRLSWQGRFQVSDATGEIGSIWRWRLFSRRLAVEFAAAAPPVEIAAFLVWIVLMVQRRQASD